MTGRYFEFFVVFECDGSAFSFGVSYDIFCVYEVRAVYARKAVVAEDVFEVFQRAADQHGSCGVVEVKAREVVVGLAV